MKLFEIDDPSSRAMLAGRLDGRTIHGVTFHGFEIKTESMVGYSYYYDEPIEGTGYIAKVDGWINYSTVLSDHAMEAATVRVRITSKNGWINTRYIPNDIKEIGPDFMVSLATLIRKSKAEVTKVLQTLVNSPRFPYNETN